jgi:hypothetical protein
LPPLNRSARVCWVLPKDPVVQMSPGASGQEVGQSWHTGRSLPPYPAVAASTPANWVDTVVLYTGLKKATVEPCGPSRPGSLLLVGKSGSEVEWRVLALAVVDVRDKRDIPEARQVIAHLPERLAGPALVREDDHARLRPAGARNVQCSLRVAVGGGNQHVLLRHGRGLR